MTQVHFTEPQTDQLKHFPEANCTYTSNSLGESCGCNQQIFLSENCDEAFYCSDTAVAEGEEGCSKKCGAGEVRILAR